MISALAVSLMCRLDLHGDQLKSEKSGRVQSEKGHFLKTSALRA